jgi:hypothetical protein
MNPELEETIYCDFITSSPTTGAATDADSTPTCEVFEDATDTAILSPTVVKRTGKTGNYRVPVVCSAANGFEAAKSYNVVVAATVGAVAAKAVVQTFQMRTNGADDLATSILTRATPANVATELANVGLTTTVTGRIDAAISTRATPAQVQTELGTYGALKPTTAGRTLDVTTTGEAGIDWNNIGAPTTTQNLSGMTISTSQAVASVSGAVGSVTGAVTVGTNNDKTGYALTSGERTSIATAIWNTLTSALTTVGSIGKLLVDNIDAKISSITGGGGGADPWLTALPGSYTAGTAGNILGNRLDVAVSSRAVPGAAMTLTGTYDAAKTASSQASVDTLASYVDTEVAAIKAKTDQLVFTTPGKVDASATVTLTTTDFNNIADAVMKRDFTLLSGEAAYSLLNAVRMLRNVWSTAGGTLTVKKEDGTTTAWTRTLSTDPAAEPITGAS